MKYEDFVGYIQVKVREELGEEVQLQLHKVEKNNAVMLDGLSVCRKESMLAPMIYLNDLYQEYQKGRTMPQILEYVLGICGEYGKEQNFSAEDYLDYEKVKSHLACKLINRKKNERLLEKVPWRPFLDLAEVVYYKVEDEKLGSGTILVHKKHCRSWGVTEQELFRQAREAMQETAPVSFVRIGELLEGDDALQNQAPMYVLTNHSHLYGADYMICDSILAEIGKILRQNYWILPSSIHECIIVPAEAGMEWKELKNMVQSVNEQEVAPEDYLSDEVYYYQILMHRLTIGEEK